MFYCTFINLNLHVKSRKCTKTLFLLQKSTARAKIIRAFKVSGFTFWAILYSFTGIFKETMISYFIDTFFPLSDLYSLLSIHLNH